MHTEVFTSEEIQWFQESNEWINKIWSGPIMEYYTAIKKNEVPIHEPPKHYAE